MRVCGPQLVVLPDLLHACMRSCMRSHVHCHCCKCCLAFLNAFVTSLSSHHHTPLLLQFSVLAPLLELQLVSSLLQGFLPSLVLVVFLAVVPSLLAAMIKK